MLARPHANFAAAVSSVVVSIAPIAVAIVAAGLTPGLVGCGGLIASPDESDDTRSSTTSDTPATAAADATESEPPLSAASFDAPACGDAALLETLDPSTTTSSFDYLELRAASSPDSEGSVVASVGERCSTAPNAAACDRRIRRARASRSAMRFWKAESATYVFLVVQGGAGVEVITSTQRLRSFLGPIDTEAKARVFARGSGYEPLCGDGTIRAVSGGFELAARKVSGRCGWKRLGYLLFVGTDGAIVEQTREEPVVSDGRAEQGAPAAQGNRDQDECSGAR